MKIVIILIILFLFTAVAHAGKEKYKLILRDHPLPPEIPGIFEAFGLGIADNTENSNCTFYNTSSCR